MAGLTSRRAASTAMNLLIQMLGAAGVSSGNTYYVDNGAGSNSAGYGGSPGKPLASIDYAVGLCTANNGDTIVAMAGHVETITAANGLDLDVAGIKVVGLGVGASRPRLSVGTVVGAGIRINAASVWLEHVLITGDLDNITTVLTINGVADCVLLNIIYRDVTGQCAKFLHAANNSDRLRITNFRHIGDSAAGSTHSCTFDGCDDLIFEDFHITGNFSTAAVGFITTASARVTVRAANGRPSKVWNQNSADVCFVDTITGSTGDFCGPIHLHLTDNAANITEAITGATFTLYDDIFVCNLAGEKAMLINWTASTDA